MNASVIGTDLWDVAWERSRRSFPYFLRYWHFINRETGATCTFGPPSDECASAIKGCQCMVRSATAPPTGMWPGQERLAGTYMDYEWVFALKAGKLGFTELECAWDGYTALFRHANTRVHLFSKDEPASQSILGYVKYGLMHLPPAWRVRFVKEAGGETTKSLIFTHRYCRPEDRRTVKSYASTGAVAIDQSSAHSHVDELSHLHEAAGLWNSINTTIEPGGTCHIVTRGAGDAVYTAELWEAATSAPPDKRGHDGYLLPFFARFDERPDRDSRTRQNLVESGTFTSLGLSFFLPETPEDALAGDDSSPYIPLEVWDRLAVPIFSGLPKDTPVGQMPAFLPGDKTPVILSLDAAITSDCFAAVAVTRHWLEDRRRTDVAIRAAKVWHPQEYESKRIDFRDPERWVRLILQGGCRAGHPPSMPMLLAAGEETNCEYCLRGEWVVPGYNVVQLCYDPYQLEDMANRIRRDQLTWVKAFDQGTERLISDAMLFRLAMQGKLAHNGDPNVREHVGNAKAKLQPDDDSRMRIIKKSASRKIDLAVAASQGVKRCMDLNLV